MKEVYNKKNIAIFALGGLDEIGKNMYVIQYQDELIIIDAGIKFPGDDLFGIDYVIPDFTYLIDNKEKIRGLFITHGHEDHIGGIPYLLKELSIPIYAGRLATAFIKEKLKEHNIVNQTTLHEITEDDQVYFDQLNIRFFRTNHSIPDSFGIVINTPYGNIVHTGDFKFDLTSIGPSANKAKIASIGNEGVLCLLSDSTNSEIPGFSLSEKVIGETIHEIFEQLSGRVIFATFASNIYRIGQAIEASLKANRKIVILGRSLERAVRIAKELKYIHIPDDEIIRPSMINYYHDHQVSVICTGSQGEPFAALSRIANGSHRHITIHANDTVIFSSSPIPGNAISINKIIDQLNRRGADVIHHKIKAIHTSGHGAQEELKLMIRLLKPMFFVPIHGEYRMLKKHTQLASECDIPYDRSFILDNGYVLEVNRTLAQVTTSVPASPVYIDGEGIGDIGTVVLRDRRILSEAGILLITTCIDVEKSHVVSGPEMITRGFVYVKGSQQIIEQVCQRAKFTIQNTIQEDGIQLKSLKRKIVKNVQSYLYKEIKRRPLIIPIIIKV
ncbi:ribonuclease J1 [Virgibacillus salexigens]|uniref:ribonuclease J1 n=1 Tax=Virgibacillus salexigens TaxID=61016 RepID=UPI001909CF24|nr:ribonuclease J [Virgibacillus salexigens]